MHHFLYKTTNLLNGRYYIGMHSTKNPNDGYLGSGKRLKAELSKYGKENFKREILEELSTRTELEQREAAVVTAALLKDPLCLNLKNGGEGGGRLWNNEHRKKWIEAGRSTPERMEKVTETIRRRKEEIPGYAESISQKHRKNKSEKFSFTGRQHSGETKQKMRKSKNVGEANSQFGSCWVTDGVKPIKIKKEQLDEYIVNGYSRGRK